MRIPTLNLPSLMNRFRLPRGRLGAPAGLPVGGYRPESPPIPASSPAITSGGVSPISTTFSNQYIVNDEFTTALAAGSVHGTSSVPGPGTRTVTDTNSKLSISGGVVVFDTGGSAVANPGMWYASVARQLGRTLMGQVNINPSEVMDLGWDISQAGIISDAIHLDSSNVLYIRQNSSAIVVGSYTSGIAHSMCVIMRATGMFYFFKGGAFTNWTMVWISSLLSSAAFPGVVAGSTTAIFTADNIRIPSTLFIPSPVASDSFNRSNGALGLTDGAGHAEANGGSGLLWSGATWAIVSNEAVNTPTIGAELAVNGAFAADTDWTKGAGWTIAGGVAVATAVVAGVSISETLKTTVGQWVLCTFDVPAYTAGSVSPLDGAGGSINPAVSSTGSKLWTYRAAGTSILIAGRGADFTGQVDNASFKVLTLSTLFASLSVANVGGIIWDCVVSAVTAGTQVGSVARLDSASSPANFIITYFDGAGNIKVDECVAGTYTNLLNVVKAFTAGDTLRLDLLGAAWRVYHITAAGVATLQGSGTTNVTSGVLYGNFSTNVGNTVTSTVGFAKGGSDGWWNALNSL